MLSAICARKPGQVSANGRLGCVVRSVRVTTRPSRVPTMTAVFVEPTSMPTIEAGCIPALPLAESIGQDRGQDDDANDDALQIRVDVSQVERVVQHTNEHGAAERPENRSAATREGRAANDDCGNDIELIPKPGVRH